jgi:hypothetical protein
MPLAPDPPYPKQRNDTIRSSDWNDAVDEVIRLDNAKVDRAGDTLTGPLTVDGALGVGVAAGPRQVLVGEDIGGIGLDAGDASPNAGYVRFGDNTGWKLHFGRSREAAGGGLNVDTTGVLATLQDNGNFGLGTLAPISRLQLGTLTAVDEGLSPNNTGAWANLGSNAFFNGNWGRVDATKPGVNLHMNGDADGAEFRFLKVEADGSNMRNIGVIGTTTSFVGEGNLGVGTTSPSWKLHVFDSRTGSVDSLGVLALTNCDAGTSIAGDFQARGEGPNNVLGVVGVATGGGNGTKFGVLGSVGGSGQLWAGWFSGNVNVTGTLSKGAGSFVIDHPLDPENKTLRHNFVESPEHLCVYRGTATCNERGRATVRLPRYFPALTDEASATVHLTPVGEEPSPASYRWNKAHSAVTVFGAPNAEIAYLVLAARDDPVIHRLARPVEETKGDGNFDKGMLLYPEAFGHPPERGVGFAMQQAVAAPAPNGDTS